MRLRLLFAALLGLLLCLAVPAEAAFTFKQGEALVPGTTNGATGVSLAFGSNVTANSLLVVCVRIGDTSTTITGITDTVGTSYSQVTTQQLATDGDTLFFWAGLVAGGAGADTVLVKFSASGSNLEYDIGEFGSNGTQTQDTFGSANTLNASAGTIGGSLTLAGANELLVGVTGVASSGDTLAATGSFTKVVSPQSKVFTVYWIQTTQTNTDIGDSISPADEQASILVAYKQAGGVVTPPVPQRTLRGVGT